MGFHQGETKGRAARLMKNTSTNDVFVLYAKKKARLTVQKLDKDTILLEGDRTALEFLGELLLAYARSGDHGVQFSPKGAGSARFTKQSTLGFYLHRLPCTEGDGKLAQQRARLRIRS
jgi:hypothetical protein